MPPIDKGDSSLFLARKKSNKAIASEMAVSPPLIATYPTCLSSLFLLNCTSWDNTSGVHPLHSQDLRRQTEKLGFSYIFIVILNKYETFFLFKLIHINK